MTTRARALVVLNPRSHGGSAARRFERVRSVVEANFASTVVVGGSDDAWRTEVWAAIARGVRVFIAAGGDGTAHALLNTLIQAPGRPPLETIALGAVGLGSSNDLHKPVRGRFAGVPLLLETSRAAPRDVVRCTYVNSSGAHQACLLISASLGIAAAANARFSEDTATARRLRRTSTTAAIAWATARTLATWHNIPALLSVDEREPTREDLSSLSVLKTEWLSGRLRYGHPVEPASGDFDVALVTYLGRLRLLGDIVALLRGRFDGRPGHQRQRAHALYAQLDRTVPLEMDGEIVAAREVRFDMFEERIQLCG